MSDGIMLMIGDDGEAFMYDDTYDITIHCESEEEQDEVKKALENYPKWIPVSERLPEEGTEVLGTDRNGCIRHVVKDKSSLYEFATYEEMMHIDIVAWMPLPDPYKEDKT